MTVSLGKGGNVSLAKHAPGLEQVRVALGWDADERGQTYDLDASALLVTAGNRVPSDQHFVFYGNLVSPCGTVVHTGDNLDGSGDEDDDEVLEVALTEVPPAIERIVFTVSIYDAEAKRQSFGQVHNAYIRLVNAADGREVARYDLAEDAVSEIAMVFGELYRHAGEWKFRAVGQGYSSGLLGIARDFGVNAVA